MTGKRTEKLQVLLSEEELAALDDWRFEMRMPSRAAAIRQLLLIALKLEITPDDIDQDPSGIPSNKIGVVSSDLDVPVDSSDEKKD